LKITFENIIRRFRSKFPFVLSHIYRTKVNESKFLTDKFSLDAVKDDGSKSCCWLCV